MEHRVSKLNVEVNARLEAAFTGSQDGCRYDGGGRSSAAFDLLAGHYRWMELVLAGRKLQRCRTAFLGEIPRPVNVLLLGEGNGRFLQELLLVHPGVRFTCVDGSGRMLECARRRLKGMELGVESGEFLQADVLEWRPPEGQFDLIVSHFFLDCFREEQLERMVPVMASGAAEGASWLMADFREPESGWRRWRARLILASMYLFFRQVARLPAGWLVSPDGCLREAGFELKERRVWDWGLLRSDWWEMCQDPKTHLRSKSEKRPKRS